MRRAQARPIGCWCPLADSSKSVEKEGTFVFSGEGYLSTVIDIQQHWTASGCNHPFGANHGGLPEKFTAPSAVESLCCNSPGTHWGCHFYTTFLRWRWKTVAHMFAYTALYIICVFGTWRITHIYPILHSKLYNKRQSEDLFMSFEGWVNQYIFLKIVKIFTNFKNRAQSLWISMAVCMLAMWPSITVN